MEYCFLRGHVANNNGKSGHSLSCLNKMPEFDTVRKKNFECSYCRKVFSNVKDRAKHESREHRAKK